MPRIVPRITLVCATALLSGCAFTSFRATATREATTEQLAGAALVVESRNGSLELVADPALSEVQISAKITCSGTTQPEADQRLAGADLSVARGTDRVLTIKPVFPGGARNGDGATITVRLPGAGGVDVKTSNGRVNVTGLAGALTIHSSNGSVSVTDHDGSADIRTSNGAVNVQRLAGSLKVDTSNGSVDVANLGGTAQISSSNGPITLALQPDQAGPIELHTSNAHIKASAGRAFIGTVRMDTSNASIRIGDAAGRVKSKKMAKTSGSIVVGQEGPVSVVETSNGGIEFEIED